MRKITAILIFLPWVVSDFTDMYQLNPEYKKTTRQMINIFEMLQLFSPQTIEHSYDEWITQYQALESSSEFISGKNISFFSFIVPGVDILRFANLRSIYCFPAITTDNLEITFEGESLKKNVTGKVQFLHDEISSSFKFSFKYTQNLQDYTLSLSKTTDFYIVEILKYATFEPLECDKKLCEDVDKNSQSAYKGIILQATKRRLKKIISLFFNSVFKSIQDKCDQQVKYYYDTTEENYYSYYKIQRNMTTFPWISDHLELFVTGLSNAYDSFVSFNPKNTSYELLFKRNEMKIRWNITTIKSRQLDVTIQPLRRFHMQFIAEQVNNYPKLSPVVELMSFLRKMNFKILSFFSEQSFFMGTSEEIHLPVNRTEGSYLNNFYDGIPDFINTVREMLQPLDKFIIQNSIIDSETKLHKSLDTAPYYKIEVQGFEIHFENVTCYQFNNTKNGTLTYKEIKAQVEQFYVVGDKSNPSTVHLSGKIYIKNAVANISLHGQFNHNQQVEVHIDDNFDSANTTITLEEIPSTQYRLTRDDRLRIGKLFRKEFAEVIRKKIRISANLMFRPIFDICFNASSSAVKTNPDHLHNQQQRFAIIHDEWIDSTEPFSIQPVVIIINGIWNFKHMTVQFVGGNVIFHDLRVENVAGSIKHSNDFNKTVTSHYNASYISLTIRLKEKDVRIYFSADSNHTIPSPIQNITDVVNKFAIIVASFIKHSIFSKYSYLNLHFPVKKATSNLLTSVYDSSYLVNVRKLAQKTMEKAIVQDSTPSEYNVTSDVIYFLTNWLFANTEERHWDKKHFNYTIFQDDISISFQRPYNWQETCDYRNNSQNETVYLRQFIQQGNITINDDSSDIKIYIPYEVNISYIFTAEISSFEDSFTMRHSNSTLQVNMDEKNVNILLNLNKKSHDSSSFQPDMLKKKIVDLANSTLRNTFNRHYYKLDHWFCKFKRFFPASSEKHFYSITKSVNYTSDHFLMYHIKLYGLKNLKSHRRTIISDLVEEDEIKWTNLKADIIWTYYIGDPPPRKPKKTSFRFDISLTAELNNGRVTFSPRSQIQFSDHEYLNTSRKLRERLEPVILSSIQHSIKETYEGNLLELEKQKGIIISRDDFTFES